MGLATPGHVAAMLNAGGGIAPIFPQQSIREMARTQRTPQQVMDEALAGMRSAGWGGITGADADHLKTPEDVNGTAAVGFTFFTIDPSDDVDQQADSYDEATLASRFAEIADLIDWIPTYRGKSVTLSTGARISLSEPVLQRAAVKYGLAINTAIRLSDHIRQTCRELGQDYEIELSVDETEQPTSLAEHFLIADQCLRRGMKLVSLAPRYIGDFEKGVDYKGDLAALRVSLEDHAAIANLLGPYKLSLHSGSDKISIYTDFARTTKGKFHVKTAGTSYLEALRVVARHDPSLFRRLVTFARERYNTDRATYHVSATLASAPSVEQVSDISQLEQHYLGRWEDVPVGTGFTAPGRQILHCTFGSTLTHPEYGPLVKSLVETHPETYREVLADHFTRHLEALTVGM